MVRNSTLTDNGATKVTSNAVLVALADAAGDLGTCASVDAAAVGDLFASANQLTLFQDAGVVYQLAVIAVLPGDAPCP